MHQAIFSDRERAKIKDFIETGEAENTNFFRLLKHRTKRNELMLIEDFGLMIKFLTSIRKVDNKEDK